MIIDDKLTNETVNYPTKEDVMSRTYDKYLRTDELMEHIYNEWTKPGTKKFLSAQTGTGKTLVISLFAIYCIDKGIPINILLPTTDCVHEVTASINRLAEAIIKVKGIIKAKAIVGVRNDRSGTVKTLQQKWIDSNGYIRVMSYSAYYSFFMDNANYDTFIRRDITKGGILIVDEAHGRSGNVKWNKHPIGRIIDLYCFSNNPVIAISATKTAFDSKVWEGFDEYDFRNKMINTNHITISIYNIANKKAISELVKHIIDSRSRGMIPCIRVRTVNEGKLIYKILTEDLDIECVRGGVYNISAENKRTKHNNKLLTCIFRKQRLPKDCKCLITTKLLDVGVNITTVNAEPIVIDSATVFTEDIAQYIARFRNAISCIVLTNRKRSDYSITVEDRLTNIVNRFNEIYEVIESQCSGVEAVLSNKRSALFKPIDDLLVYEGDIKIVSREALSYASNEAYQKYLDTHEKFEVIKSRYRDNITIIDDRKESSKAYQPIEIPPEVSNLITEFTKINEMLNEAQVRTIITELCKLDIDSEQQLAYTLYIAGLLPETLLYSIGVLVNKDVEVPLIQDCTTLYFKGLEFKEELGVVCIREALLAAMDAHTTVYSNIQSQCEIVKATISEDYGYEFVIFNNNLLGGRHKFIRDLGISLKGKTIRTKDVYDYIKQYAVNTIEGFDVRLFDHKLFPSMLSYIKSELYKITINSSGREGKGEDRGRCITFSGLKSKEQIYDEYVNMLYKLGVTRVVEPQYIVRSINKRLKDKFPDLYK